METQKNRQSTNTDLRKDVESVEDTYKDGEKKSKPQIWCAVAPTGWMGCWRRGQIKQNSTFDSKTVLKIHAFSFCSHTYHTYSHLLGYTAWRISLCFPAHFKGLYFTSMHLVFLCSWLQSSLMKSDSDKLELQSSRGRKSLSMQKARDCGSCYGFAITANRSKSTFWHSKSLVILFCFSFPQAVPAGEELVIADSGLILAPHINPHYNAC